MSAIKALIGAVLVVGATLPTTGCMTAYYLTTSKEDRACFPDLVCSPGERERVRQMRKEVCTAQKKEGAPPTYCDAPARERAR